MSEIIKSNVYNFNHDVLIFNIESTHFNPQLGEMCEFSAFLLDKEDLEIKDRYNIFIEITQRNYDDAHEKAKKLHEGKWDIYLAGNNDKENWEDWWKIIESPNFIPDFYEWIVPHVDEGVQGNLISVSWDSVMSHGFIQKLLSLDGFDSLYKKKYSRLFRENIDLKSLYRALFMISKKGYNKSALTETMNYFGIENDTIYGIERCDLKYNLFKVFCDFGVD